MWNTRCFMKWFFIQHHRRRVKQHNFVICFVILKHGLYIRDFKGHFTYHYLLNLCFYFLIHQSGRAESRRLQLYAGKADELSEFQLQPGEYLQALMPETDAEQE